ncbi:Gibberellin-regulated protein 4 [Morella rubra]|uniref:Gibberellin-regulated protein 4 n=1 Tax=Morella rubra TaxID=262757 RepID=A0A6A1VFT2_9ROSI|nr:Gibberellin-regulated protein 4 [Morella rubra]
MAVAKFVAALLLALIAVSLLQSMVMASHGHGGHHYGDQISAQSNLFDCGQKLRSHPLFLRLAVLHFSCHFAYLVSVLDKCPSQCTRRCSKTQYHKPCMFYCQKCCKKCLCVPPGYYGNKAVCPCYNNWKTKEGGPKCP